MQILLFCSILGLVISINLIFLNVGKNRCNIYLGAYFFIISLFSLVSYLIFWSKSIFLVSIVYTSTGFLQYLIGPLFYFYIRSVTKTDARLGLRDYFHFIPALVFFIASLPYIFSSYEYKTRIATAIVEDISFLGQYKATFFSEIFSNTIVYVTGPLHIFFYTIWSVIIFSHYLKHRNPEQVFIRKQLMNTWLFLLLGFQLVRVISHILAIFFAFQASFQMNNTINFVQSFAFVGITGMLISTLFFPSILYGLPLSPISNGKEDLDKEIAGFRRFADRNTSIHLDAAYILRIGQKADACMRELQPYLHPDFNLAQLSVLTEVPIHHLAYYFREQKDYSFNDYRNQWRVDHAKQLITEGKTDEMTLEGIGQISGFANRKTFISAFKKAEGFSPKVFLANSRQ